MVSIRKSTKNVDAQKKVKLSTTISPYLKKRMDEIIEKGEFNSAAAFTDNAFSMFITTYDKRDEMMSLHEDVQELKEQMRELTDIIKSLKREEKKE